MLLLLETPLRVDGNYVWPIYDSYDIYEASGYTYYANSGANWVKEAKLS